MGCGGSKQRSSIGARSHSVDSDSQRSDQDNRNLMLADTDMDIREIYSIGKVLGRGGFSIVYEATNHETDEVLAVKVIEKDALVDDFKLLKREIEIMRKVEHENILKLKEIYEDDDHVYIVMELVDGDELFDRIVEKGYYSENYAVGLVKQIVSAVQYLHEMGIAHRDLKPENLLCAGEGEEEIVKIADFGLSKIFNGGEELMTSCGTPGYVAPEVLMCDSYDKAVDMWGIGIITYILLAGYPPFFADNDTAMFERIMNADYDFDDECWDEVTDLAKDFINKLLNKHPDKRLTAEEAAKHPWLETKIDEKELHIGDKFSSYQRERKETTLSPQDSLAALQEARMKLK
eukprot:TRINITY_DN5716_c0_g1_i1.p1 TRINITY_DN5716_c0_g1~~TRINITY_DN5716_c0_g1_i1.p1  ORF type:complete len:347 (-),score=98.51 TRINITY_DN5716_c0_g1_i1:20-1060(-)